jgi:hypothetical protein
VEGFLLVACLENELVAFAPGPGAKAGAYRTSAEIRTAPILVGGLVVMGLRDRSVIAYSPTAAPPPAAAPAEPAPPEGPVVPQAPGR